LKIFITICGLLFIIHQLTQKLFLWSLPLLDSYLDPLLCVPLLLFGLDRERHHLWKSAPLSALNIFILTAFFALLFEGLFPYLSDGFTQDWVDIFFYFTGAGLYIFFRKWEVHRNSN
jgi:hypothetical protein